MKIGRRLPIAAIVMLAMSVIQLGWWCYDQYSDSSVKQRAFLRLYAQQSAAAEQMLQSGAPVARVARLFPDLDLDAEGTGASLSPSVREELAADRWHRINRYMWESSFFLIVLVAGIAVIWRALAAEKRVVQEQDSFLALVSHQFKTPLASLQLSLETMQLRPLAPEHTRELMDRMLGDIARMEAMVTQILDGVRVDRGRVELKPEPVALASAVAHVIGQVEPRARLARITLENTVPSTLEVFADPLALDVVIRNVLENALAAVEPLGGGTVRIAARGEASSVELAVTDTGVGFDAADRERMFEKYVRLTTGGVEHYHGTGLGLYIVQRLMRLSGGGVQASSAGLGQGATFTLAWPARRETA